MADKIVKFAIDENYEKERVQEKYKNKKENQLYRKKDLDQDQLSDCNSNFTYDKTSPIAQQWFESQKKLHEDAELKRQKEDTYKRKLEFNSWLASRRKK